MRNISEATASALLSTYVFSPCQGSFAFADVIRRADFQGRWTGCQVELGRTRCYHFTLSAPRVGI